MSWPKWTLIVMLVLSSLASISSIGRGRTPVTHGVAIFSVALNAAMATLVVYA